MSRILVVDDDVDLLNLVSIPLRSQGFEVDSFDDPLEAEGKIPHRAYDLILTDLEMPERNGLDLLKLAKEVDPSTCVILLTGHAAVDTAVEAMKMGAFDYLKKPFPNKELLAVIEKGLRQRELEQENRRLRSELREKYHFENLVGNAASMQKVFRMIERAGPTDSTVLILGESGTGKELAARAIHETSNRAHRRFLKVNCSALTDSLLESELFGHIKGSFTGAAADKRGLFEAANGGTLFLDEVGDTSPALQAKLLRVLQEGEIRPVGGTEDKSVDVRVIAATNRDLKGRISEELFREDLYFRLNVVSISLPPLRERKDDIPLLIHHFLQKKTAESESIPTLGLEVQDALLNYSWPGNIRELENVIERATVLREAETIELRDLPHEITGGVSLQPTLRAKQEGESPALQESTDKILSLQEMERVQILQALKAAQGHREKAANLLGITRRTLYQKIKRYGIQEEYS
ncbi:MAG: sigma-54-dependent Fis family transcriptional regulator [Candidatus Omnitrophica bacterium]|nr:sigma-54-dependent Fis family transcriptional regulator [Candidatus Omnitrophota bacterium]MCA9436826.1 sigma-54-dependent Fis family transcriptional regulator [Candidatus Omnitrophota bacterium]